MQYFLMCLSSTEDSLLDSIRSLLFQMTKTNNYDDFIILMLFMLCSNTTLSYNHTFLFIVLISTVSMKIINCPLIGKKGKKIIIHVNMKFFHTIIKQLNFVSIAIHWFCFKKRLNAYHHVNCRYHKDCR